jgi:hypothetical protein
MIYFSLRNTGLPYMWVHCTRYRSGDQEEYMAKKLMAISTLRPRIVTQGIANLETLAGRMSKNSTFNSDEIYGMLRLLVKEAIAALQAGESVKLDGLVSLAANMKVGGEVDLTLRGDRGAVAALNNHQFWTADKVANHANVRKTIGQLVELWNSECPDDRVEMG